MNTMNQKRYINLLSNLYNNLSNVYLALKKTDKATEAFLEKYNDIALLADLMGHESIETTRIYLRRTASEQQELVDKIVTW